MKSGIALIVVFCAGVLSLSMRSEGVSPVTESSDTASTKTLLLLRHAKSDKSGIVTVDFDRPLEESGRKEAEEMGHILAGEKIEIDLIISSPSARTKETLQIMCPEIGYAYNKVVWDSSLYACTGDRLIQRIHETNDTVKTVLFAGHNPSITDAANTLQTQRHFDEVKTCGLVAIDFYVNSWPLAGNQGILRFYHKPK